MSLAGSPGDSCVSRRLSGSSLERRGPEAVLYPSLLLSADRPSQPAPTGPVTLPGLSSRHPATGHSPPLHTPTRHHMSPSSPPRPSKSKHGPGGGHSQTGPKPQADTAFTAATAEHLWISKNVGFTEKLTECHQLVTTHNSVSWKDVRRLHKVGEVSAAHPPAF